jgi:phenylalanyl-tRNA synthetase beta chain
LDLWDLKALLEDVVARVYPAAEIVPGAPDDGVLVPPLGFSVQDGERRRGAGGVVNPRAVDTPPWAGEILALELSLPAVPAPRPTPRYRPLPAHPSVSRDLALLVPVEVPARAIHDAAREAGGSLLEELGPFDLYEGEGLAEGVRSLAWRFRFRALDRTLTDDEVERALRAILDRLGEELGVHVRK